MIAALLERARRRAQAADALGRSVERTSVAFESGRLKAAGVTQESGVNLRLVIDGRIGVAGTTALSQDGVVERAVESADLGERVELAFPPASAFPPVPTADARARDASLDALTRVGQVLIEGLSRDGCQVNVSVERAAGVTEVGNTAGAAGSYESTTVAVTAEVSKVSHDDVLMVYDQYVGVGLPDDATLDALVRSITERLDLAARLVEAPVGALPVVFTPAGSSCLLLPLEQALSGKSVVEGVSPLAGRLGEAVFDASLTLEDDATRADGPDSRPFDDEGVPSRRLALIDRGVVSAFIYDLETAARARVPTTGHGSRAVFGKPHSAYSNLVVGETQGKGDRLATWPDAPELLSDIAEGLVVDELIGVGQGNVMGGAFSHPVALAYRVVNGEIVGRVKQAVVAGNVYQLFRRPIGFGRRARWTGRRCQPALRVEGVSVAAK